MYVCDPSGVAGIPADSVGAWAPAAWYDGSTDGGATKPIPFEEKKHLNGHIPESIFTRLLFGCATYRATGGV